ncbi:MAG TPA: AI-2E family transporter [Rickettsiales bacterium]|nr:AI-2E family transporter [Rickettsiales bacterium]
MTMNNSPANSKSTFRIQLIFWSAGIILFFYFLSLIKSILLPFVVGMLAAYFLNPAVRRLQMMTKGSRSGAAAVITILFFSVTILLGVVLVPLIAHQLTNLLQQLPDYIKDLQDKYSHQINHYVAALKSDKAGAIKDAAGNVGGTLAGWAGNMLSDLLRSSLALLNVLSLVFITPIVVFYLLRDWEQVVARFNALLPRKHERVIREQLRAIDRTLSGFIRGQTNVCLIMATYYALMLTAAGLNFGLGLGIMTGFLLFVPFVGIMICLTLSMTVALFQFGLDPHLIVIAAIYLVGMALEGSMLTPKLVGNEVGLHPVWIIFGMLSGAALFGFVGVLISVPVTSVIGVLARFAIERYKQSVIYLSK